MYQLFQVDGESGIFSLLFESKNFIECANKRSSSLNDNSIIIFNFFEENVLTEAEETGIIFDLIQKSNGQILRVTKGLNISKNQESICCGTGNCYCVVENGAKHCETYYCNEQGYCWIVRCNIPCGC